MTFSHSIAVILTCVGLARAAQGPCKTGENFQCSNGTPVGSSKPPCPDGKPQCCAGATCTEAPAPGGGQAPSSGGAPGAASACKNPTCASPPCAAARHGDIGCTTVAGVETISHEMKKKGETIETGAHIFGPFEAGFGAQQKSIIEGWGCTDPTVAYEPDGGMDIDIAEKKVSLVCGITFPRTVSDTYIGVVGMCGGHTKDYHFHKWMSCLYAAAGAHSTKVGESAQWSVYGKWEDFTAKQLPLLDACGGHFGVTPDSNGKAVYHYHVQQKAPFVVGCHGPTADNKLVSVAACRALYPSYCKDSKAEDMKIKNDHGAEETVKYARYCPCYDANGMNTGAITELPAIASSNISVAAPAGESNGGLAPEGTAPGPAPSPSPNTGKVNGATSLSFHGLSIIALLAMCGMSVA